MNIYFGRAQEDELDFGDLFVVNTGNRVEYFYQAVEFGTNPGGFEEVRIHDTCNRSIPIGVESIPELIVALQSCYNTYQLYEQAVEARDRATSNAKAIVDETWENEYEVNHIV